MIIRPATDTDLPGMMDLLRIALGGTRSASFWQWKHSQNPFGSSLVLLGIEGDQLVGIRAFLRWRLRYREEVVHAWRPVDTSVHPSFHGNGIFTQLTSRALDEIDQMGSHLVFNTPNPRSGAGYLKLGWSAMGNLPVRVRFSPLNLLRKRTTLPMKTDMLPEETSEWIIGWMKSRSNRFTTDLSVSFLEWRYLENPMFRYSLHHRSLAGDYCLAIVRTIDRGPVRELRICELIHSGNRRLVVKTINDLVDIHRPAFTTLMTADAAPLPAGFIPMQPLAPVMMARISHFPDFGNVDLRDLSAGTMEIF